MHVIGRIASISQPAARKQRWCAVQLCCTIIVVRAEIEFTILSFFMAAIAVHYAISLFAG